MTDVLISICIPTYNGEKYIKECIDSCIAQTYANYEIIICDDGSTDGTAGILEQYAGNNANIKFFKNAKNLGLVGNWNKCIELATGEWIKFVFQDDYITHDCLQEFVKAIDEKTILITSKRNFILPQNPTADYINYYTNEVRTLENTVGAVKDFYSAEEISKAALKNISMNFIGEPSLILFKKSILKEMGPFNPALKQICDLEFVLRIASKYGLKYINQKICAFRVHADSTTNTNLAKNYFQLHYIEPLLFSYFLLFDKQFLDFRKHLTFLQTAKLKLYFKLKAYRANIVNAKEFHGHALFAEEGKMYKEIQDNRSGSLFIKLLSAIL